MDDEALEIKPWPLSELAGQLIARTAVGRRGVIEVDASTDVYERETDRFELEAWARTELTAWLMLRDFQVLDAAADSLADDELTYAHDALMEASTIAWAVAILPERHLPVFTSGESEQLTLAWAPGPWTGIQQARRGLRIRSDTDLASERERWEILYWRMILPQPLDRDARTALRDTIAEVRAVDLLAANDEDLLTDAGVPVGQCSPELRNERMVEAEIRLRTLNWICGLGDRLASTPLFFDDETTL